MVQGDFNTSFPKEISHFLIRDFRNPNLYFQNLVGLTPLGLLPAICPTLQNDRDYQNLVNQLLTWNFENWRKNIATTLDEEFAVYIPTQGDLSSECHHPEPMSKHINDFFQNKSAKVLLVLGSSGSGKTIFGQQLFKELNGQNVTSLWISLPALQNVKQDMMDEGLRLLGVLHFYIESFKQKANLIILDAYDKVQDLGNLYESNHFEQWNTKVIINCRSEYLNVKNYNFLFKPTHGNLWERHIAPFSVKEIYSYLEKYVELEKPS